MIRQKEYIIRFRHYIIVWDGEEFSGKLLPLHLIWPEVSVGLQGWWWGGAAEYEMGKSKDMLEAGRIGTNFPLYRFFSTPWTSVRQITSRKSWCSFARHSGLKSYWWIRQELEELLQGQGEPLDRVSCARASRSPQISELRGYCLFSAFEISHFPSGQPKLWTTQGMELQDISFQLI